MTRTVALTGASGFVGGHIMGQLADRGWRVRALFRRPKDVPTGVLPVIGSLEDRDSLAKLLEGAEGVIHAAAAIKGASRRVFDDVNVEGTRRLAEAAAAQDQPPAILLLSSLAAREPQLSSYAHSKLAAEAALAAAPGRQQWTVIRAPAVYGPGDRETLGLIRGFLGGLAPVPAPSSAHFSLIHVSDLAAAAIAWLEAENRDALSGKILGVQDGHPGGYSWPDMAAAVAQTTGTAVGLVTIPKIALMAAAYANQARCRIVGKAPMLTPGKVRELTHPDWVEEDDRLGQLTGWRPRIGLESGISETLAWYRAHDWL